MREQRKAGYIKIKVLELLLFLSDLGNMEEMQEPEYYNQNQVKLTKEIAAFITEDLTMHYTIEQLSERFGISMTTLKKGFMVYMAHLYIPGFGTTECRQRRNCCWKQNICSRDCASGWI